MMVGLVDYFDAEKILKKYGIRSVESKYVESADAAASFAGGDKIVLKLISDKALHKSKSGLVAAGLETEKEIRRAYFDLSGKGGALRPYKILAQKMVKGQIEIIIGGNIDEQFGKMILLGLGGIYVEAFKDFALRICPITERDAQEMLLQLRSKDMIAKDQKSKDLIVDLLLRVSKLFMENSISELDLNPIILHDGIYDAVDLRMIR